MTQDRQQQPHRRRVSRREFVKTSAGVAGALGLSGTIFGPQLSAFTGANDTVGVGFIGIGIRGDILVRATQNVANTRIVEVCDIYDGHFDRAKEVLGAGIRTGRDYRRMLDKVFVKKLAKDSLDQPLFWNSFQLASINRFSVNHDIPTARAALPTRRPFLIAGGALVRMKGEDEYPDVVPVEYTPLYSGIRQQFGRSIGGSYIESWAFDRKVLGCRTGSLESTRRTTKGISPLETSWRRAVRRPN